MYARAYIPDVPGDDFSDDAVLVKALTARDPEAFAYLLDRYHAPLVRLAQQYVPSRAVADEVVQETWLAVIEGIDRFEQRSSLKTWLFRILVNIARTHGVKEHRSIPFATNTITDNEPAVDPHRFRRFTLKGRGTWAQPPQPWSEPERRALDAEARAVIEGAVDGCRRNSARCSRCVTSSTGRRSKCATRSASPTPTSACCCTADDRRFAPRSSGSTARGGTHERRITCAASSSRT